MIFSGLYTAMVTPFQGEALDLDGFSYNLKRQIEAGVDGVVVLGTTGECATLTEEEQEQVIRLAVEEGQKSKLQVIVGTGGNSTRGTLHRTLIAQALGADGALLIAPYYNKPTQKGIYKHYQTVAEAVEVPLIVYNNPSRTGVSIDPLTIRELAELPKIVGIKQASDHLSDLNDLIHYINRPDFALLSGDDPLTFPLMAMGGHGAISTLSNLLPLPMYELIAALANQDIPQARSLHFQLLPLFKALAFETNPIPIKAAMEHCGLPSGHCRLPLTPMSEPHRENLIRLVEASPFQMASR